MTLEIWLAYVTTLLIFMSTPGPSHMLMLSNSMTSGFKRSLATAAGDLSANTLQILIVAFGLVGVVRSSPGFFTIIKWLGVSYLVFIGITVFRRHSGALVTAGMDERSPRELYLQGFFTSAANPKAIVFFAALLPQFINTAVPTGDQFLLLGATYLIIDGCFLTFYGAFAAWIAERFRRHIGQHMNRISGVLLVVAAVLLGLKDLRVG
jgi:threonine/homoserine/homoserine lactone efflux protein